LAERSARKVVGRGRRSWKIRRERAHADAKWNLDLAQIVPSDRQKSVSLWEVEQKNTVPQRV
jgi:hypothetical protein